MSHLSHQYPDSTSQHQNLHNLPDSSDLLYNHPSSYATYQANVGSAAVDPDSTNYVTTSTPLTGTLSAVPTGNVNPQGGSGVGHIQQRRGSLQLWQFLIALLDEQSPRFV